MSEGPAIFPLWDGKGFIGYHSTHISEPFGKYLIVCEYTYGNKAKNIKAPIKMLLQSLSKTQKIIYYCLDVRKKSKSQIAVLNNCGDPYVQKN